MIFSLFIGQQLGYDSTTLKYLAICSLLHDVGRLFLPSEFTTGYMLGKEDKNFVELHAMDGASFLAGVSGLPTTIVRVALEHHIFFDGSGYPKMSPSHVPHPFSQIVGLSDFASWETASESFYHKPVLEHRLVKCLLHRMGKQFDPVLIKLFLPMLGLYPPGTELQLESGGAGIAIEPNIRNIERPAIAKKSADGASSFEWLGTLSDQHQPPFIDSVLKTTGRYSDPAAFIDLLPDSAESK